MNRCVAILICLAGAASSPARGSLAHALSAGRRGASTDRVRARRSALLIAFQMARLGDPAGVGRGLFLLDIKAMEAARK